MTLVEILVAFVVLILLVTALVSLSTQGLETWSQGEARKDLYDRAETVLSMIARDLRNVYAETEVYDDGRKELPPPLLQCDVDKNRNPRIRFVRTGKPEVIRPQGGMGSAPTIIPPTRYGPAFEVAYVMHPDPAKAQLCRGVRGFDRRTTGTLLKAVEYQNETDPLFEQCFQAVESGVLHVGYDFWTQFTTTWDDSAPLVRARAGSKQSIGPEKRWDSGRKQDDKFFFYRRRADATNPDFVYPEIVRVTVTIERGSPDEHGMRVVDDLTASADTINLTHARGLPDAPGLVRLDGEWIEYGGKSSSALYQCKRGRRGTLAAPHAARTGVRFGETFTTEVRLAVYREAQEP
jgi:hypothetical protein